MFSLPPQPTPAKMVAAIRHIDHKYGYKHDSVQCKRAGKKFLCVVNLGDGSDCMKATFWITSDKVVHFNQKAATFINCNPGGGPPLV